MPKIKIDKDLYKQIEDYTEAAGYSSVEEFVKHAIEKELENLNQSEDENIQERLKGLGYI